MKYYSLNHLKKKKPRYHVFNKGDMATKTLQIHPIKCILHMY